MIIIINKQTTHLILDLVDHFVAGRVAVVVAAAGETAGEEATDGATDGGVTGVHGGFGACTCLLVVGLCSGRRGSNCSSRHRLRERKSDGECVCVCVCATAVTVLCSGAVVVCKSSASK